MDEFDSKRGKENLKPSLERDTFKNLLRFRFYDFKT